MSHLNYLLVITLLCAAITGCDNALLFSELTKDCVAPKSSARFGKNQGPIITSPAAMTPSQGDQVVSGTCVDGLDVFITGKGIESKGSVACTNSQFTTTVTFTSGDGTKELDVFQKSSAEGSIVDRLCFEKDTVAPKVEIKEKSSAQAIAKKTVTVSGVCENGLEVVVSGPNLDNSITTSCSNGRFQTDVTFSGADGLKNVVATQVDLAGNQGDDDQDYLTDTVAPIVRLNTPTEMSFSTGNASVTGTCESGLDVILAGNALSRPLRTQCLNSAFSTIITIQGPDGIKEIQVQQSDDAGNTGRDQRNIQLDSNGPILSITEPAGDYTNDRSVIVRGICESGLSVFVEGSGLSSSRTANCSSGTFTQSVSLTSGDGTKAIQARQVDAANNTSIDSKNITLDTTAPSINITSPSTGSLVNDTVIVQGTCESGIQVSLYGSGLDSATTTTCSNSRFSQRVDLSDNDGQKEIFVAQTDLAGNIGTDSETVLRDDTAPAIQITSPVSGTSTVDTLDLVGNCENGLDVNLSGNIAPTQVSCTNGRFSQTVSLLGAIGNKVVTASQTDANGNTGSNTQSYRKVNNIGQLAFTSPGPAGKVDILFIDDNSASMEEEQKRLGDRFSSFAIELNAYDWQAGITTTDCDNTSPFNICGSLIDFGGTDGASNYILNKNTPNFLDAFQKTIQRPETYDPTTGTSCIVTMSCPSTFETPLLAAMEAMTKRNDDNSGFFRDGADLAIVILSDEDENNTSGKEGEDVVNHFKNIWSSDKKLQAYGIIVQPGNSSCNPGNEAKVGTKISEFVNLTGGFTESICETDYTSALRRIGQNVTKLNRTVELAHTPIANTLRIVYNPAWVTNYVVEGNQVIFDEPAPLGTQVTISYEY